MGERAALSDGDHQSEGFNTRLDCLELKLKRHAAHSAGLEVQPQWWMAVPHTYLLIPQRKQGERRRSPRDRNMTWLQHIHKGHSVPLGLIQTSIQYTASWRKMHTAEQCSTFLLSRNITAHYHVSEWKKRTALETGEATLDGAQTTPDKWITLLLWSAVGA